MSDLMTVLLVTALCLLVISVTIVRKLTKELPKGVTRRRWFILGGLILLFFFGYLGFFVPKYGTLYTAVEILVTGILFFGAVFVLLVCLLAYRTTQELKRIYVLEVETITDPLLGIFNRRYLDRRLEEEVLRAKRHKLQLSLLMVDIDNFKMVNDTWGHQIGDLVLKHLTQLLVETLRHTDIIARFGGEEFVVLLPHTPESEALKLAEKLRIAVEKTPLHQIPELSMTVSIGSSCLLPNGDNAYSLLERADKAMYWAKREGRNQAVSFSDCEHAENPGSHPLI
ncbi:MAG: GGDEF domain-containing protein [Geobacteraceae bacterium]|nr:GGDEF domain-containing protein [Geobacteraceae bacterium]NTW78901.1 GGDEF domain-containing protein [Geobacteraceae bacterium]